MSAFSLPIPTSLPLKFIFSIWTNPHSHSHSHFPIQFLLPFAHASKISLAIYLKCLSTKADFSSIVNNLLHHSILVYLFSISYRLMLLFKFQKLTRQNKILKTNRLVINILHFGTKNCNWLQKKQQILLLISGIWCQILKHSFFSLFNQFFKFLPFLILCSAAERGETKFEWRRRERFRCETGVKRVKIEKMFQIEKNRIKLTGKSVLFETSNYLILSLYLLNDTVCMTKTNVITVFYQLAVRNVKLNQIYLLFSGWN